MIHTYPPAPLRRLITLFTLAAAFMTQLDATIANVALPDMQASTSSSREQISWVLTSYIVMAATFTPLSGWLAGRFGRKRVFMASVVGFTLASALCGVAQSLSQLIAFRLLQGMMGSALLPMSQAIMLDINPPQRHGSAMAVWGAGAVLGPVLGPVLGGWLTDGLNWRWVFYINLPVGVMAFLGLLACLPESRDEHAKPLDFMGFAMLGLAVAMFQLVLDRGQGQDWFSSTEICVEVVVAVTAFYLFLAHSLTAKHPFVNPLLFRDPNYLVGNIFGFFLGGIMYGVLALLPPMLVELYGYPTRLVGMVTAPRGLGTLLAMAICGPLATRVDPRVTIMVGLALCGWSLWLFAGIGPDLDQGRIIWSGLIQGVGGGVLFIPISTVVFSTLSARHRNEGAAMNSLIRNLAGSVWIAVLEIVVVRNDAKVHSRLVEAVRPDNPVLGLKLPGFDMLGSQGLASLERLVARQSLIVAYNDAFWVLLVSCFVVAPFIMLLRPPRRHLEAVPAPIEL